MMYGNLYGSLSSSDHSIVRGDRYAVLPASVCTAQDSEICTPEDWN